ncbi:MAG: DUF5837 family cyanobactin class RiPP [Cyanobacteria bacterium P01_F01_bin.150]
MNKKTISPNPQQPVDRTPTGQLPSALLELSEDTLCGADVLPAADGLPRFCDCMQCSFDGDDE